MKLTGEAESFISELKGFDVEAFKTWIYSIEILAGQNHVMQYISEKKHWNAVCVSNGEKQLRVQLSNQAQNTAKYLPEFDNNDFIVWFNNSIELTKGDVLNYLAEKK